MRSVDGVLAVVNRLCFGVAYVSYAVEGIDCRWVMCYGDEGWSFSPLPNIEYIFCCLRMNEWGIYRGI